MKEKDNSWRGQLRAGREFLAHKDEDTGQIIVMGRNKGSWAKITLFFLVFYGVLACFFAAMLTAFYTTVPSREEGPKLIQYLKDRPGINSYPRDIGESYNKDKPETYNKYVESIKKVLKAYAASENQTGFSGVDCDTTTGTTRKKDSDMCNYNVDWLGNCSGSDPSFGYDQGRPCIILRMNKIFSWIPEPSDNSVLVNVTCNKPVTITPNGFYVSFFPFWSELNYLGPLVAIQLHDSETHSLECKVIGKNIEHSETFRRGKGAYGQLLIEVAGATS